ncbi:MAG: hypothetical protein HY876_07660 [Coriobacteriales bacterium]|nr:hypothetical protein [Coriobacteriales bacterium]
MRLDEEKQELKEKKPADLLPSAVDGWDVEGPQVAPGTSGGIVEAVYLPKDEERNLATPIVAYAQSAHGGGKSASTLLKARDERYPSRASGDIFQGFVTARGFSNDGRSYYMTWAQSGVTYGVEVSFQYVVPSGKSGLLKRSAEEVARAVVHHARTGGGGAGGGMQ